MTAGLNPHRLLITGATGFIGRHLVREASDRGHEIHALVRETSNRAPIEAYVDRFIVGDLAEPETLAGISDGVDAVIHAACAVAGTFDASQDVVERFLAVNRDGTVNLARAVLDGNPVRFVHISSTAAMGPPATEVVDETSPCNPQTPYQISKRAAELALLEEAERGLDVVILRPCVVAGEGKDGSELLTMFRLVRRGLFPLIGNRPGARKPIIMVDDLVAAALEATTRGRSGGIYLLHSGGEHTMGQMLAIAAQLTGSPIPWIPVPQLPARAAATVFEQIGKMRPSFNPPLTRHRIDLFTAHRDIDISRARRELNYDPQYRDLHFILSRAYDDFLRRGLL